MSAGMTRWLSVCRASTIILTCLMTEHNLCHITHDMSTDGQPIIANMLAANTNYFFWVVILSVIMYTRVNNRKISARCSCRIWWHARVYCWLWWWSWWCRSYPGFIKCRKESWCKTSHQGTLLYWFNTDSIPGYSSRYPTISILYCLNILIQYQVNLVL